MAFDKTNTFILGKNDKGDNEKRPDYRGEAVVKVSELIPDADGNATIDLSGWIRTKAADGSKFISGAAKQRPPKEGAAPKPAPKQAAPIEDDDIPF